MERRLLGKNGEEYAVQTLIGTGCKILERNYRCHKGEMDIIALEKKTLVFVEVRTKSSGAMGWGEESITRAKRLRLRNIASQYILERGYRDWPLMRIDVIALCWNKGASGQEFTLRAWIKGI